VRTLARRCRRPLAVSCWIRPSDGPVDPRASTAELALNVVHRLAATADVALERFEHPAGELYWALGAEPPRRPLCGDRQLAWYAARVDRARELIESRFDEDLSLARLAREVGMSLYSFARVFAELAGETPHRYLVGVRLHEAARRLSAGQPVTEVAHVVGYGSLGHFISSFRRAFGATPSRFARSRTPLPPRPGRGAARG
jgi:AraC-like DNA-binding protein